MEMEKQKSGWKETHDTLLRKLAAETKATRNFQALKKSYDMRMQLMESQYFENTKSMAAKTIERDKQMRAKHDDRKPNRGISTRSKTNSVVNSSKHTIKMKLPLCTTKSFNAKPSCMRRTNAEFEVSFASTDNLKIT